MNCEKLHKNIAKNCEKIRNLGASEIWELARAIYCVSSVRSTVPLKFTLFREKIQGTNICRKGVKLDEPFGSILYLMMIYFICTIGGTMYDTFRYTQSKRVSKKGDWCTTGT